MALTARLQKRLKRIKCFMQQITNKTVKEKKIITIVSREKHRNLNHQNLIKRRKL